MRALVFAVFVIAMSPAGAAADNPKQAAIAARQGKAYFDAKQYDQAIDEFKKSYDLDPSKSVTLFKIASAYYAKGDYAGAKEYYAKYLAADPDGPLAPQALEFTTIANQKLAEALAKAEVDAKAKADAAAKAKADADKEAKRVASAARTKQAAAFEQAGAWSAAGDEYRAAADVGEDPEFLLQAAVAYAKQPDNEKARAVYQAYLDKVPLGAKSDEVRVKVAELTRAIDKALAERVAAEKAAEELRLRKPAVVEDKPSFEFAASVAPGVKLRTDNPFVVALRGEAALRFGRRVNLGVYAEYARLATSGACGTSLPGPDPSTPFDIGPRNQLSKCAYFLPGLQLYVHIFPNKKLDPYIGIAPGFRIGQVRYTTFFNEMKESHSDTYFGIVAGVRAGVTYHLSPAVHAWTVGGFIEAAYQLIGDAEGALDQKDSSYVTIFVGGRSTVTF